MNCEKSLALAAEALKTPNPINATIVSFSFMIVPIHLSCIECLPTLVPRGRCECTGRANHEEFKYFPHVAVHKPMAEPETKY